MNKHFKRLLLAGILTAICIVCGITEVVSPIDNYFYDTFFQNPKSVNTDIKIIAIDDESLSRLGKFETWTRDYYAKVVENLTADPNNTPAVIGFDIIFSGYTDSDADFAFAEACEKAGNVVAVSQVLYNDAVVDIDGNKYSETVSSLSSPFPELSAACIPAFANTYQDSDNYVRKCILKIKTEYVDIESFAMKIYKKYTGDESEDILGYSQNSVYSFDYSSEPGMAYTTVSFADILDGNVPGDFGGSIVLIGAYATGMMDEYSVPIARGAKMYGVEIHANIIDALANGYLYTDVPTYICVIIYAVVVFALIYFICSLQLKYSGISVLGTCVVMLLLSVILRTSAKMIFPVMLPVIIIAIGYIVMIIDHYVTERAAKGKILKTFKQYLSPEVVEQMSKQNEFSAQLGGEKRNIACLFIDVRGFTKMSEELTPEKVVWVLNQYLGMVTEQIFKNKGMLDKYVGDAVMAVYNAPVDLEDYAACAVQTGLDIKENGKAIQKTVKEMVGKDIKYGIGINVGEAVVGNIGCDFRMDYTAIGDTVNTAARLEANAAGDQILISEALYEMIKDKYECKYIGGMRFKNKAEDVICYEVISKKGEKTE